MENHHYFLSLSLTHFQTLSDTIKSESLFGTFLCRTTRYLLITIFYYRRIEILFKHRQKTLYFSSLDVLRSFTNNGKSSPLGYLAIFRDNYPMPSRGIQTISSVCIPNDHNITVTGFFCVNLFCRQKLLRFPRIYAFLSPTKRVHTGPPNFLKLS